MSRTVLTALLILSFSIAVAPVFAQTLTGSGSVTVSAVVSDNAGELAQVLISSMASTVMPNMSANVTVTNEGTEDYEYFYEWCVMSSSNDFCGSGNNTFYASASKFILLGQNWNTILTATVLSPGTYYFKTTVYFGSHASSASYQFTTTSAGGGGGATVTVATAPNPDGTRTGMVVGATAVTGSTPMGNVTLTTPSNLVVTGPAGWTGDIVTPTVTTTLVAPVPASGNVAHVIGSIEVGSGDALLTLNKAVRLVFAGQAGNFVGYSHGADTFQKITQACADDTQAANDLLTDGADCERTASGDLIVWTKHFSVFTTYTESVIPPQAPPVSPGSSNNNSGAGSGSIVSPAASTIVQPLATTTLRGDFNKDEKVNIVDFSILLSYWGAKPPFKNPLVDLNGDGKINSIDFSILLYLWGKKT